MTLNERRDESVEPGLADPMPEGPQIGQDGRRERVVEAALLVQEVVLPHDIPARISLDAWLNASTVSEILVDQVPLRDDGLEPRMADVERPLGSRQRAPGDLGRLRGEDFGERLDSWTR